MRILLTVIAFLLFSPAFADHMPDTRKLNADEMCADRVLTSTDSYFNGQLEFAPRESMCVDLKNAPYGLGVVTIKPYGGDIDVMVYNYNTKRLTARGENNGTSKELITFGGMGDAEWNQIVFYNASDEPAKAEIYLHNVGFDKALEGALTGAVITGLQAGINYILGIESDSESDDFWSLQSNTSRVLTMVGSGVQRQNLAQTTVSGLANEVAIGLRQAGVGNATANIITSAVSAYLGEIYNYYN